jgi:hypothetical protein
MGTWGHGDMGTWGHGDMGTWGHGDDQTVRLSEGEENALAQCLFSPCPKVPCPQVISSMSAP